MVAELFRRNRGARGVLATKIVEAIRGEAEWIPPQYGDESEPKNFGQPLNVNGSFDEGAKGWDRPDHVQHVRRGRGVARVGGAVKGKVLRVRTDLARDPWLEYTRNIRLGLSDPDKPADVPKIARDTSYDSVAGLEGVHFRSDWIKVTPGPAVLADGGLQAGDQGHGPEDFPEGLPRLLSRR